MLLVEHENEIKWGQATSRRDARFGFYWETPQIQIAHVGSVKTSNWPNNSRRLVIAEPVVQKTGAVRRCGSSSCRETWTVNRASSARLSSQCLTFVLGVVERFLQFK